MNPRDREDITTWAGRLEAAIRDEDRCCLNRVVVLDETTSTQDAAVQYSGGRWGLLLVAGRQTAGRGSRDRAWDDGGGASLSATFVLDAVAMGAPRIAACAGLAALDACVELMPKRVRKFACVKWPNDIVIRKSDCARKLAGVLVERTSGLTLVGIGVNVYQRPTDWAHDLAERRVSMSELGACVGRIDICTELVRSLCGWMRASPGMIRIKWAERDALFGRSATFEHDAATISGRITSLDPLRSITVETTDGEHSLPVETTRLINVAW